jgi:3'-phosphoadenosine 5'-phosphosulfate sulfotransferase (PAPS reductase)/FAD synthetase
MCGLLGRRGDPNAEGQEVFCPSSRGWPPFLRVNPILDWTYHDVWAFLRVTRAHYCTLYDRGYTSVGSTLNTAPNRSLHPLHGASAIVVRVVDGVHSSRGVVVILLPPRSVTLHAVARQSKACSCRHRQRRQRIVRDSRAGVRCTAGAAVMSSSAGPSQSCPATCKKVC